MNKPLYRWSAIQAARINALRLGPRLGLFLAALAAWLAALQWVVIQPAQTSFQALSYQEQTQALALQQARQLQKTQSARLALSLSLSDSSADNPAVRVQMAILQTQLEAARQHLQVLSPDATHASPLENTLVHLLRSQEGLKLLHTAPLASPAPAGPLAPALPLGVLLQGLELTVSGAYPDLTRYVATLERELVGVRWGSLTLKSDQMPPELTLHLFLVRSAP